MEMIIWPDDQGVSVYPHAGMTKEECVMAAQEFCRVFRVKYIVTLHNDQVLQVTQHGLVQKGIE